MTEPLAMVMPLFHRGSGAAPHAAYRLAPDFERVMVARVCSDPSMWRRIGRHLDGHALAIPESTLAVEAATAIAREGTPSATTAQVVQRVASLVADGKITIDQRIAVEKLLAAVPGQPLSDTAITAEMKPHLKKRYAREVARVAVDALTNPDAADRVQALYAQMAQVGEDDAAAWPSLIVRPGASSYTTAPPARQWLLTDSRSPMLDGVLARGNVGEFVGTGGFGKSSTLAQLLVANGTGTPWLGTFQAREGRGFIGYGEEDAAEVQRKLYYAAQCARVVPPPDSIVTQALRGTACALIESDRHGNMSETGYCKWLRDWLVANGPWSLIALDPTSRFGGADVETENAAGTRYVQALESIAIATGASVLFSHHTNKVSRGRSAVVDATSGRGSSSLYDGARWVGSFSVEDIEHEDDRLREIVTLTCTKSNYSRRVDPLLLRRDPDNEGMLVPLDAGEVGAVEDARKARAAAPVVASYAARTAAKDTKVRQDAEALWRVVQANPGCGTRKLLDASRLGAPAVGRALELLTSARRVENRSETHGKRVDPHYFAVELEGEAS